MKYLQMAVIGMGAAGVWGVWGNGWGDTGFHVEGFRAVSLISH